MAKSFLSGQTGKQKNSGAKKTARNQPSWKKTKLIVAGVILVLAASVAGYWYYESYKDELTSKDRSSQPKSDRERSLTAIQSASIPEDASPEDRSQYLQTQANAARINKNYDAAIERYQQALALPGQDQDIFALQGLGDTYEQSGNDAKAKETYQRLLEAYRQIDGISSGSVADLKQKIESL